MARRVLICGGHRDSRERLAKWAFRVLLREGDLGPVKGMVGIQGCAAGWDTYGRQFFISIGCRPENGTLLDFPIRAADWSRYGKAAGPIRNRQMRIEGKPDLIVAGPGRNGTADMIKQGYDNDIPVIDLTKERWFQEGERRYHALYGQ